MAKRKKKTDLLKTAKNLVKGARRDEYGPIQESFERVATVWSGLLGHTVTAQQVALMMIGFKLCREVNKHKEDNLVDVVGYVLCLEEVENG